MHSHMGTQKYTPIGCLCLNPCCNGRCTRTKAIIGFEKFEDVEVLILVVMEDALAQR